MNRKSKKKKSSLPSSSSVHLKMLLPPLKENYNFYNEYSEGELQELLLTQPHDFKHCKLKIETRDLAYARPLSDPTLLITIEGRENIGRSFPYDEVCVQILTRELEPDEHTVLTGKVVGLMKRDEVRCTFICKLEGNNQKYATPLQNNMTKIRITQTTLNKIEIRKFQTNSQRWVPEESQDVAEDQLLLVKVLKWENHCDYPLGVVTKVFPRAEYLNERFKMETGVKRTPPSFQLPNDKVLDEEREDFHNDTTFTIDSATAEDLDDAISVTDAGETYVIGVHITDVANYISKDSEEDKFARLQGRTIYHPHEQNAEPAFMFSRELSSEYLSLIPDIDRKAISLLTVVDKATGMMMSRRFILSIIRSDRKLSYEEADQIIKKRCLNNAEPMSFSSVEDCVAVAYNFTKVHRKCRLDGNLRHSSDKTEARCMVEELMILYNSAVAEELISTDLTRDLTPLRCHQEPEKEMFEDFKREYSTLLPLSPYLSYICEAEEPENVLADDMSVNIITSVFRQMEALAESRDCHTLAKLITLDKLHPTLLSMEKEFQSIQRKAVILRSCSSLVSKLGHFDLHLNAYTCASSPMRRYLDLILQRLLHWVLSGNLMEVNYTQEEIDHFCESGMEHMEYAEKYELDVSRFLTSAKYTSGVVTEMAVVDELFHQEFTIALPFKQAGTPALTIMFRHLKVAKQPEYNNNQGKYTKSVSLHWERRMYSFIKKIKNRSQSKHRNVTPIPIVMWRRMISAVKAEDWDEVQSYLQQASTEAKTNRELQADPDSEAKRNRALQADPNSEEEDVKKFNMELKIGEVLQVQIGPEPVNGTTMPMVKLLSINPFFEVCLEHARNPTLCFSKTACRLSKLQYTSVKEYQAIWSEICQMDTAYNAVEENNSVILEDVSITWTKIETDLEGYFQMTQDQKKSWYLEFDIMNSFLCIQLRDQYVEKDIKPEDKQCDSSGPPDPQGQLPFTWVAHGVAKKPKSKTNKEKKNENSSYIKIHFQINLHHMGYTPPTVFDKKTRFTVEVIPKKIPYVLREQAVANLRKANNLVKSIATGKIHGQHSCECEKFNLVNHRGLDLKYLNESQKRAVEEALQQRFTVIQGPPGTGKTEVGIQIVYQFYMKNKAKQKQEQHKTMIKTESTEEKIPKKCGILYCGPSNKSVDIVAEQLLKLRGVLKPLRIYSDQMEMREFPYPGSQFKLCRKSLRDEKPKEELREISLMYLVRESQNRYSNEIKDFEEGNVEFDLESYRQQLKEAQKHELLKHDVILCTCSAALKPILIETMDFRQIIIDECAMATEPEAFIPLVSHDPQQIVLLGDHKQVHPIVSSAHVKQLGMQTSLFERYMNEDLMLDTQYRMHKSICEFPSDEFYGGRLKTGAERGPCLLLNKKNNPTAILFGHVQGREVSLVVSTKDGNENSVANPIEAEQAVRVVRLLIHRSRVSPEKIAILTPYNAQMTKIKELLQREGLGHVSVCTIMKSQGSEWPFVILSTVRSCSEIHALSNPRKVNSKLGFITNPNQVNVAITRAQDGLCILGDRDLLRHSELWRKLLSHYEENDCVLDSAEDIKVKKP